VLLNLNPIFRSFNIKSFFRTSLLTVKTIITSQPRSAKKITLLTFSIYPDLARVWYQFLIKSGLQELADIIIVDSSGKLKAKYFPKAKILYLPNLYHSKKIDYLVRHYLKSKYILLCDDDRFIINKDIIKDSLAFLEKDAKNAAISFTPRTHWQYKLADQQHEPLGVYSLFFNRDIYLKEKLKFTSTKVPNTYLGNKTYYDTGDKANELLIKRGYQYAIFERDNKYIQGMDGLSTAAIIMAEKNTKDLSGELISVMQRSKESRKVYLFKAFYGVFILQKLYASFFKTGPLLFSPLTKKDFQKFLVPLRSSKFYTHLLEHIKLLELFLKQNT
jgi:hypothetical protein